MNYGWKTDALLILGTLWLFQELYAHEIEPKSSDGKHSENFGNTPNPLQNSSLDNTPDNHPRQRISHSAWSKEPKDDDNPGNSDDADNEKKKTSESSSFMEGLVPQDFFNLLRYVMRLLKNPQTGDIDNPENKANRGPDEEDKPGKSPVGKGKKPQMNPSGTSRGDSQQQSTSTIPSTENDNHNDNNPDDDCPSPNPDEIAKTSPDHTNATPRPPKQDKSNSPIKKTQPNYPKINKPDFEVFRIIEMTNETIPAGEFIDDYINNPPAEVPGNNNTSTSPAPNDDQMSLNQNPDNNESNGTLSNIVTPTSYQRQNETGIPPPLSNSSQAQAPGEALKDANGPDSTGQEGKENNYRKSNPLQETPDDRNSQGPFLLHNNQDPQNYQSSDTPVDTPMTPEQVNTDNASSNQQPPNADSKDSNIREQNPPPPKKMQPPPSEPESNMNNQTLHGKPTITNNSQNNSPNEKVEVTQSLPMVKEVETLTDSDDDDEDEEEEQSGSDESDTDENSEGDVEENENGDAAKNTEDKTTTENTEDETTTENIKDKTTTENTEDETTTENIEDKTTTENTEDETTTENIEDKTTKENTDDETTTEDIEDKTTTEDINDQTTTELPQTFLPDSFTQLPESIPPADKSDVKESPTDIGSGYENAETPKVKQYNSILEYIYRNSQNPMFESLRNN